MSVVNITSIESDLHSAGVTFLRRCDWTTGWTFSVDGKVVAKGFAIGQLERDLVRWWNDEGKKYSAEAVAGP